MRSIRHLTVLCLALSLPLVGGCDGDNDCRNPRGDDIYAYSCVGGIGGICDSDRDCPSDAECCRSDNCGGGMCTYACRTDRDCPSDMLCEHDVCFFACDEDRDCDVGATCEHDRTICEF